MYYETGGDVSECEVGSVMKGDQGESGRCMEEEIQEDRSGRGLERREWWARFRTRSGCVCWARMKCLLTKIGERYWSSVAGGVMNGWAKLMKVLGRTAG